MALVNGLMQQRQKDWSGKVVVVAVSLDDAAGRQKALEHAEKKGWTNIVHVWSGEGEFDAPVAKSFAIDAIPVSILFDQHGHVAWRGHPGEVDLAALVTNLLRTPPSPTHAFKGQSPSQKWIHGGEQHVVVHGTGGDDSRGDSDGGAAPPKRPGLFRRASTGSISSIFGRNKSKVAVALPETKTQDDSAVGGGGVAQKYLAGGGSNRERSLSLDAGPSSNKTMVTLVQRQHPAKEDQQMRQQQQAQQRRQQRQQNVLAA